MLEEHRNEEKFTFTPPSDEYEKEFREKLHVGPKVVTLKPVNMSELEMPRPVPEEEDDGVMIIKEIGMVPMSDDILPPPPVLQMMEMMDEINGGGPPILSDPRVKPDLDYIEEKTTIDGTHIHKEVHESNGVKTV